MSINSPAKQERIERHLMRQRGAGIIATSTVFRFAFGTNSSPSSEIKHASQEQQVKRRKTILSTVAATDEETAISENSNQTGKAKRRRRLDFATVDAKPITTTAKNGVEDSFVTGIAVATRKTHLRGSKSESEAPQPVKAVQKSQRSRAPSRSRAAPAVPVLDEEVAAEEVAQLNKKRRTVKTKRKFQRLASGAVPVEGFPVSETTAKPIAIKSTTNPQDGSGDQIANIRSLAHNTTKVEKKASRKATSKLSTENETCVVNTRLGHGSREPLKPTDINATRPSVSPTKTGDIENLIDYSSDRLKAKVSQANVKTQSRNHKEMQLPDKTTKPKAFDTASVGQDIKSNTTGRAHKAASTASILLHSNSDDEDIDWLFEANTVLCPARKPHKAEKTASRISRSRTKTADIDLDDLLSNIASFAAERKSAGSTDVVASRASKPRTKQI